MLSKLLKYELKATARWFLPLYIALIVLTLLNKLTMIFELPDFVLFNMLEILLIIFYVLVIIFTSLVTMILLIVRFYKNILTDEGYLTHTLPVKSTAHLNCKILSGCIWTVSSFFMQIISLLILFAGEGIFTEMGKVLGAFGDYLKNEGILGNAIVTLVIFVILMLISVFYGLLMMYCSLSLGSLFSQHKIIGAIVMYFAINFVVQLISMIGMFIGLENSSYLDTIIESNNLTAALFNYINIVMIISGIVTLVLSVVFYILSNLILSKKLNLD